MKLLSLLFATSSAAAVFYYAGVRGYGTTTPLQIGREVLTAYLSRTGVKVVESTKEIRRCFRELPDIGVQHSVTHSHPVQAENRARAVAMMTAAAQTLGRRLFMLQRSKRDEESGIAGSRAYYWMKDTDAEASSECPSSGDIVGIVDTDYYLDMPYLLSHLPCPAMVYTIIPRSAGEVNSDGLSFYFDDKNYMHATISGAARYHHLLWDYGLDILTCRRFWGFITRTWNVDRRTLSTHAGIMMLTPRHMWTGIASQLTRFLYGESLRRLKVAMRGWVSLRVHTDVGTEISIARVGSPVSAAISLELDEGLRSTVEVTKMPITVSSVESQVAKSGVSRAKAAMLCAYYRQLLPQPEATVFPVEYSVKRFQYGKYEPDAKPSLMPYMSPIVNEAFVPDRTLGNEERSIDKRVKEIAVAPLPITPEFLRYVDEFATHIFPRPGILVPVDEEDVWERQCRPSQRRILEEASCLDQVKKITKTFLKAEAYGGIKDPRTISTINPKDKLNYSRVVYAMAEVLKCQHWYAFGRTPKQVSERVAEICSSADFVVPNDISRMDGTVNNKCRHLEQAIYMRGFSERYHDEVLRLMKSQYKAKGIGMFGTVYATEWARLSGSPETSTSNSLDIAFVAYVGYRKMGLGPEEAYAKLGVYGGDDGLSPDINPTLFVESAKEMGLKLTSEVVQRNQPGIHFLARLYTPDVWYGDGNSCCDLKRQLSKFHTCTVSAELDPVVKLMEKGYSYYLTDKNTPIIGEFTRRVKYHMDWMNIKIDPTELTPDKSYSSLAPLDEQYPNEWHPWFEDHAMATFPAYDAVRWYNWLSETQTLRELLSPPCLSDPDVDLSVDCMVNGEKLTAPESVWSVAYHELTPIEVRLTGSPALPRAAVPVRPRKPRKRKSEAVWSVAYHEPTPVEITVTGSSAPAPEKALVESPAARNLSKSQKKKAVRRRALAKGKAGVSDAGASEPKA